MHKKVKLFFAGDFCSKPSTSFINVDPELQNLIRSCDHAVINFEVPLKPDIKLPKQARERFFQNDDAPHFLREVGFNLFSLANNHMFDWDDSGFQKTRNALGVDSFGAGTYDEAYQVKIVETNGIRIGFLAVSFAAYKGVFYDVTKHDGFGCAYINDLKVNHVISEAKRHVDYLFVLPHDGIEYIDIPLPETIARYRDFIDYGADGVIGSHPHCPQGWEIYKEKPIFYSLGNFFFNSKPIVDFHATKPHWYEGRCVIINIDEGVISWDIINTRNIGNKSLIIDKGIDAITHNQEICDLLNDMDKYNKYLSTAIQSDFDKFMNVIDITVHQQNLSQTIRAILRCLIRKIVGKPDPSDRRINNILRHDLYRYIMMRKID